MSQDEITKVFENVSVSEMQGLLKHLEAQKAEMAALSGKTNEEMLKFYMDYKAKVNKDIAAVYPQNPKGKTIKDCMSYITTQAQKLKVGNCAMVHHSIVFNWAEQYFLDNKIEKNKTTTTTTRSKSEPKISVAEMQAKIDAWNKEQAEKIAKWNEQHEKGLDEWNKKHPIDLWGQRPKWDKEDEVNPYLNEKCPYDLKDAAPDKEKTETKSTELQLNNPETTTPEANNEEEIEEETDENDNDEIGDIDENGNRIN